KRISFDRDSLCRLARGATRLGNSEWEKEQPSGVGKLRRQTDTDQPAGKRGRTDCILYRAIARDRIPSNAGRLRRSTRSLSRQIRRRSSSPGPAIGGERSGQIDERRADAWRTSPRLSSRSRESPHAAVAAVLITYFVIPSEVEAATQPT